MGTLQAQLQAKGREAGQLHRTALSRPCCSPTGCRDPSRPISGSTQAENFLGNLFLAALLTLPVFFFWGAQRTRFSRAP